MKKILCMILVLTILSSVLAGCGHEHIWEGGDCTTPAVCSECGEEGDVVHTPGVWRNKAEVLDGKVFFGDKMTSFCAICSSKMEKALDYSELASSQIIGVWGYIRETSYTFYEFKENGEVVVYNTDGTYSGTWEESFGVTGECIYVYYNVTTDVGTVCLKGWINFGKDLSFVRDEGTPWPFTKLS